ncbi:MAG: hypothetical protein U0586_17355 [Candidatus Brocadiaceae bacterium]
MKLLNKQLIEKYGYLKGCGNCERKYRNSCNNSLSCEKRTSIMKIYYDKEVDAAH